MYFVVYRKTIFRFCFINTKKGHYINKLKNKKTRTGTILKFRKITLLLTIIFIMIIINLFSSQPGYESNDLSKQITKVLISKTDFVYQIKNVNKINAILRKVAHFTLYFCLALVIYIFIYRSINKPFIAFIFAWSISTLYATLDEYYQTSVSGRSGCIRDVKIDSLGALTALSICIVIFYMKNQKKI